MIKWSKFHYRKLRANPYQPRKAFDQISINELAESIREHGVIQPIIVRSVLKVMKLLPGKEDCVLLKLAGKDTIPAVVRDFPDQQVMEIALIENLQREDLNAIEIAVAYQNLMDQFSLTQEELSVKLANPVHTLRISCVYFNFLKKLKIMFHVEHYRWVMHERLPG